MFEKEWQIEETLANVAKKELGSSFDWSIIQDANSLLKGDGSNFTLENILNTPSIGRIVRIPSKNELEASINKVLIGAGGRVDLKTNQAFMDFSQVADANSVVSKIMNLLGLPSTKIIDFRF